MTHLDWILCLYLWGWVVLVFWISIWSLCDYLKNYKWKKEMKKRNEKIKRLKREVLMNMKWKKLKKGDKFSESEGVWID